jgi:hypothetical protein
MSEKHPAETIASLDMSLWVEGPATASVPGIVVCTAP